MKTLPRWTAAISAPIFALCLMACQQQAPAAPEPEAPPEAAAEPAVPDEVAAAPAEAPALPCGIVAQRNWQAELSTGGSPSLTVSGEIDLGTPGFGVSLARDPAEASGATAAALTLQLRPPSGMVTQVVTPHPVRYFGPARGNYESVQITCDGAPVATINLGG